MHTCAARQRTRTCASAPTRQLKRTCSRSHARARAYSRTNARAHTHTLALRHRLRSEAVERSLLRAAAAAWSVSWARTCATSQWDWGTRCARTVRVGTEPRSLCTKCGSVRARVLACVPAVPAVIACLRWCVGDCVHVWMRVRVTRACKGLLGGGFVYIGGTGTVNVEDSHLYNVSTATVLPRSLAASRMLCVACAQTRACVCSHAGRACALFPSVLACNRACAMGFTAVYVCARALCNVRAHA
jgi:hypothetical protein